MLTGDLIVALAGNLIDLVPNSGATVVTWLMAGALTGYLERLRFGVTEETQEAVAKSLRAPLRYRREHTTPILRRSHGTE